MAGRPDVKQRNPSVMVWEAMRKKWVWFLNQQDQQKAGIARIFFNKFIQENVNYQFTVVQVFSGLYEIAITIQQYERIKSVLEKKVKLELPDVHAAEILEGATKRTRTFRNLNELRSYKDGELSSQNRQIVKQKSKEAAAHYIMVKQSFTQPKEKTILAFDIEVYEYNFEKMQEIGYFVLRFTPKGPARNQDIEIVKRSHYIIEENLRYKNANFVPDNRYGFKFGTSQTMSLKEAVDLFRKDVMESDYLLGHSTHHDKDYLKNIGVDVSALKKEILDTQLLQIHKDIKPNDQKFYTAGLTKLLKDYGVTFKEKDLHNAGNDAYYTMMLFLRQMDYSAVFVNEISSKF